ncbi:hypothetical protein [Thioalkalivibrio sp. ALE19]|uniref:hypothetical protein n=1 Tax=Thioalkalivibrio sp. ALE19 TaxID=1266909 RepID=UPI000410E2FC|nr:hypothetical protein [Thioalkalivibrio sp. ALE19]
MNELNIVGIGGAGLSIAREVHAQVGGQLIGINTDRKSLEGLAAEQRVVLGPETCGGMDATSPARGRKAAEESIEEVRARLPQHGRVVLVAGLGGGVGTGVMPVIAREAIQRELDVLVAVTLPFGIEADRRDVALSGRKELDATGAAVITRDHAEHTTGSMGLEEALAKSVQDLAQRVQLWIKGETDVQ